MERANKFINSLFTLTLSNIKLIIFNNNNKYNDVKKFKYCQFWIGHITMLLGRNEQLLDQGGPHSIFRIYIYIKIWNLDFKVLHKFDIVSLRNKLSKKS